MNLNYLNFYILLLLLSAHFHSIRAHTTQSDQFYYIIFQSSIILFQYKFNHILRPMFFSHYCCGDKCCPIFYQDAADDIFELVEMGIQFIVMIMFPLMVYLNEDYIPQHIDQLQLKNLGGQIIGLIVMNYLKKIFLRIK